MSIKNSGSGLIQSYLPVQFSFSLLHYASLFLLAEFFNFQKLFNKTML